MNASNIATAVIQIPRTFGNLGNVSIFSLLKGTGYFEMHDQVSEAEIHEALIRQPECVDDWMLYSDDKRSSEGWYLKQGNGSSYTVGFYTGKASDNRQIQYSDRLDACAAFIKHEIEVIRRPKMIM